MAGLASTPCYYAPISGFPDVLLKAVAVPVGNPCVGKITQTYDNAGQVIAGPHAAALLVHFEPPDPSAPSAFVGRSYDDAGTFREGFRIIDPRGVELLSIDQTTRLIEAWQSVLGSGLAVLTAGRPTKVTADTAAMHAALIRTCVQDFLNNNLINELSQKCLVDTYGSQLGYTTERGFAAHLKKLRPYGFTWPESFQR